MGGNFKYFKFKHLKNVTIFLFPRFEATPCSLITQSSRSDIQPKFGTHLIMPTSNWGKLVRATGGSENDVIPEIMLLYDKKNYFGRVPNADMTKFSHSQQFAIPLPYLSSTHFCIEMKSSEDGDSDTFFLTDHSRNGTFFRHKQNSQDGAAIRVEHMDASRNVMIKDGDEIILMFRNEITVIYKFTESSQSRFSKTAEDLAPTTSPKPADSHHEVVAGVDMSTSKSRKRAKEGDARDNNSADNTEVRAATTSGGEGGPGGKILKQQLASLQQENKGQERRLAAVVAANTALTMDLNSREREVRTVQSLLSLKETECGALTDSLRATEANFAATEARVRILEDLLEVSSLNILD